jgi:hypothetical protein
MRDAPIRLHWRGERLTEDTIYALALTGASWLPDWGVSHSFTPSVDEREQMFRSARDDGRRKEAIAAALSLVLAPPEDQIGLPERLINYLEREGVDVNRVVLGIIEAPERLPGLPSYLYSAVTILTARATPRETPFLLQLAENGDVYIRSRAVVGLGKIAYVNMDGHDLPGKAFPQSLVAYGLSASERGLIERQIMNASQNDSYRVRAAAALAMAMSGGDLAQRTLQRLSHDRAYILEPSESGDRKAKRITFPVRMAADAGLERFGEEHDPGNGDFSGRDLSTARRGGQDVTNDHHGLRHDQMAQIFLTDLDRLFAVPLEHPRAERSRH